ncbi:glycosyl transferase [Sulfuricaulis limicola]|uniref:Glycosyl transferase n=2 Tax=Sulfuricaulis limicola TaxID=1620215 RepID=A0A1B4XGH2_9GAMM|nr:glycosyl transferase [Sulfuricaulis limicola]
MRTDGRTRVMSLFWNFIVGGVAQYAAMLEGVTARAPISIRSFCVLGPKHHVNRTLLDQLGDRVVVHRATPWDTQWIHRLREEMRAWAPDIVMSHGFNSHFMARIAAVLSDSPFRAVCSYHGLYHAPTPSRRMIGVMYNQFTEHYIRRRACSTIAVAEYCRQYLVGKGADPSRIEVIHNGISDLDKDLLARERLRKEWNIRSGDLLVGIASRFDPIKGIATLVDAFGRVAGRYPQTRLVLIGAGSLDEALRAQVASRGLSGRVVFTGFRTDIAACLEAMDVFVLPSLAEAHSISLLEAMRAGKAIIVTDVGGNTESARHEQEALIVPPADVAALADAMERLVNDVALRSQLGMKARERFLAEFRVDQMVARTSEWLVHVAAQPVPCR